MAGEALSILADIRAAALTNAVPLPSEETADLTWQGLGVRVGGTRLVCPMGDVEEVINLPPLTHIPAVKSFVLGVANIRGRLVPVIDLHRFLGVEATQPRSQWRVIVVEDDDIVTGFVVEQALGIQYFPEGSMSDEMEGDALTPFDGLLRGSFRHGGRVYYELDLRSILRDERFFDVAD